MNGVCDSCGHFSKTISKRNLCFRCDNVFEKGRKEGAKTELEKWINQMALSESRKLGFWSVKIWINKMEERLKELEGVKKQNE